MADVKISELAAASTPLDGTETVPIVQSTTTVKATVQDVMTGGVIETSASAYTIAAGISLVNVAGATCTTTIGYAASGSGREIEIRKSSNTVGTVTVVPNGSDVFGPTSLSATVLTCMSDGDFWRVRDTETGRWDIVAGHETGTHNAEFVLGGGTFTQNGCNYTLDSSGWIDFQFYGTTINLNATAQNVGISLPYPAVSGGGNYYAGSISYVGNGDLRDYAPVTGGGKSYIYFHQLNGATALLNTTYISQCGTSGTLICQIRYQRWKP